MHLRIEPWLNGLTAARPALAEAAGYYYGLLHFLVTPLVLAWRYWRRPAAFGRLRSALVLGTTAASVVFWAWPAAPPRLAVPGMIDILVTHDILGAADQHGAAWYRMRSAAARRHTAIECLAGSSARARRRAPARPQRERR